MIGTPEGGERPKPEDQPQAKQITHAQPAMRRADAREPVRVAGDVERSLPDARGLSPGATKGNRNALKQGRYTAEAVASRREAAALIRTMRGLAGATGEGE